jgi:hypothetical protein
VEADSNTNPNGLGWAFATEHRRDVILVVLWAVSITSVFAQAIFQRGTATIWDLAILMAISVAAGAMSIDFGKAVLSYFMAMTIGITLLLILSILPALTGVIPPPGDSLLITLWVSVIFKLIFPIPLFLLFLSTLVGAAIGEHYFY